MNKRRAKKKAYWLASQFIDQALAAGGWGETVEFDLIYRDEDFIEIEKGLEKISQMLFMRGGQ